MIRMVFQLSGQDRIFFFGLSKRNLELLQQGKPIFFDGRSMNLKGCVVIHFGETEQAILDEAKTRWGLEMPDVPPDALIHPGTDE
jgi:hypothetical protein